MTIDRTSVEEGARLAAEVLEIAHGPGGERISNRLARNSWDEADLAFIAHWNPEFAAELARDWLRLKATLLASDRLAVQESEARLRLTRRAVKVERELQRLRRVEEAAREYRRVVNHPPALTEAEHLAWKEEWDAAADALAAALANPAAEEALREGIARRMEGR